LAVGVGSGGGGAAVGSGGGAFLGMAGGGALAGGAAACFQGTWSWGPAFHGGAAAAGGVPAGACGGAVAHPGAVEELGGACSGARCVSCDRCCGAGGGPAALWGGMLAGGGGGFAVGAVRGAPLGRALPPAGPASRAGVESPGGALVGGGGLPLLVVW
jgi:hypothetical protein